jgi:hypothetical protein
LNFSLTLFVVELSKLLQHKSYHKKYHIYKRGCFGNKVPFISIYESSLFICFVCHVEISQTIVPLAMLLVPLESTQWMGVHWVGFCNVSTYIGEVIEYWTIFFWKIHINQNWTLHGNLGMVFVFPESPQWVGFNEADLEIFRPKVWEIMKFLWMLNIVESQYCHNFELNIENVKLSYVRWDEF